jgi:two-component system nitrate/nitrite response regulator NarL
MGNCTATAIIEPRSLVRAALVSLMESNSYRVVCNLSSVADIEGGAFEEVQPKLVILGALPAEHVAEAASIIRRCWQDVKIIMLSEKASSTDLRKLWASGLDACIPMSASPRTLRDALQLIVGEQLRVLMVSDSAVLDRSADPALPDPALPDSEMPGILNVATRNPLEGAARGGRAPGLSRREEEILKALVQGQSNKVIARTCTVTEATVKVHVKSILRKIRVANRTQAAIWALQNA